MRWHHERQHPQLWLKRLGIGLATTVACLAVAANVRAGNYTFSNDIPVTLEGSGISLTILSGSTADQLTVDLNTLTVQVAAAESFMLRYPGPTPGTLANASGLASCNNVGGNNDVTVTGPATVVFTPNATACAASGGGGGGGGGGNVAPSVTLAQPNGGATYDAGSRVDVFWSAAGTQVSGIRLSLSTDGGATFPTVLSASEANDGHFAWTVPDAPTAAGRLKAEAIISGGSVGASDASDADFSIRALPATVVPAPTIDVDKQLPPPPDQVTPLCVAGSLIKTATNSAVYYCGKDGKRYVFPNQGTYFSWYSDFKSVVTVTPDILAGIRIGGNVTYKPGTLVKIQTDPKVYVVSRGGQLRWLTTEAIAISLYGTAWSKLVRDVPDSFFVNYVIGPPL